MAACGGMGCISTADAVYREPDFARDPASANHHTGTVCDLLCFPDLGRANDVVPELKKVIELRCKRTGISHLTFSDLPVAFQDGNPSRCV